MGNEIILKAVICATLCEALDMAECAEAKEIQAFFNEHPAIAEKMGKLLEDASTVEEYFMAEVRKRCVELLADLRNVAAAE